MKHTKMILVLAGGALSVSGLNALADSTTVNKDEVRAIVAEMLADAQSRSSLLQGQGNAGYDKKFYLASPDNNYRLNIGGYVQFRYGLNFGNDDAVNEFQTGFSFRRARLEFGGHIVNPDLKFLVSGDFADTKNYTDATAAFPTSVALDGDGAGGPFTFNYAPNASGVVNLASPTTLVGAPAGVLGGAGGVYIRDVAAAGAVNVATVGTPAGQFIDFNGNNEVDAGEFASVAPVGGNSTFSAGANLLFVAPTSYTFNKTGFALKDAVIDYTLGGGWYVRGGQYKLPFLKEELVADTHGLSAERSVLNDLFTGSRSQGVGIGYRDETFRFMTDYSDGFNAENTPFSDGNGGIVNGAADFATTTRVEWAFAGNLDDWKQFTSLQDDEFKGYVGAAFHYQGAQNDEDQTVSGLDLSSIDPQHYVSYTADVGIKGSGFSLFAAFVGSNTRFLESTVLSQNQYSSFNDFGVNVQGSYRFTNTDEVFARWDGIFEDSSRFSDPEAEENFHFLTVGWNHYFAGQAARFTVDSVIALTETRNDPANAGGFGRQGIEGISRRGGTPFGDNQLIYDSNDTGQVGVRFQFQLLF